MSEARLKAARPREHKPKSGMYSPTPHLREDDINKAQPPVKTMKGIGNGAERVNGYGRGR